MEALSRLEHQLADGGLGLGGFYIRVRGESPVHSVSSWFVRFLAADGAAFTLSQWGRWVGIELGRVLSVHTVGAAGWLGIAQPLSLQPRHTQAPIRNTGAVIHPSSLGTHGVS